MSALKKIGEVSRQLNISIDTLRYYEKIELLQGIGRTPSGLRRYDDKDLSKLRFIQRAQKMNFSLAEIAGLLKMRGDPQHARSDVRELAREKLDQVEQRLEDLTTLRNELQLLVNLCEGSNSGCPIIEGIEAPDKPAT